MPRARRPDAASPAEQPGRPRIGLALAGGGPLGAVWEIGALCAIEEALPGVDFVALDGYVGVSAGAFLAAGLANGLGPRALCAAFIEEAGPPGDRIHPTAFLQPAWGEFAQRAASLPRLALQAAWQVATRQRSLLSAAETLGRALPTGLFSHAPLEAEMRRVLSQPRRSNDFRQLQRRLVLVATDLDRGTAAPFGMPGWDEVPISLAVAASAALPGLYPPVSIGGRSYADGALKKTLHASVLLDMGLDLVLCLNPLVPFDARPADRASIPPLVQGGLPVVLAQTFRSLIHSRLELGLKGYERSHPGTDLLLFEPDHHDPTLFTANIFGYRQRRALAEHAYQRTRADLWQRRAVLGRTLARHGLALELRTLKDADRRLLAGPDKAPAAPNSLKSGRPLPMTR
ncbi:MAG: patatin-like phospholipase family protein [Rubrivivax sp.]|nr:patatin-like phospholipase family protein [Rubrivivax sp.]